MPRAMCRCGQTLEVPPGDSVRIVCPGCGARVRVRPGGPSAAGAGPAAAAGSAPALPSDGFLRFSCPCGRRLKVSATEPPPHGQCPDCGAIVPIPRPSASASALPTGHPETPTAELSAAELANLERWTRDHLARATSSGVEPSTTRLDPMAIETKTAEVAPRGGTARVEVGLRTCPNPACQKPLHLSAETCPHCGTATPRR